MPTANPRVNLTLPQDLHDSISEFAALRGSRPSTFIREMLLELQPSMDMTIEAVKTAKEDEGKALTLLHNVLMKGIAEAAEKSVFNIEERSNGNG